MTRDQVASIFAGLNTQSRRKPNPAAVALGKLGGKTKSDAKTAAARENGKKGGRPAKKR